MVADMTNVRLLMAQLHEGESEALVQAEEKAAEFFIGDEKDAREIGRLKGFKPVGTVRLLRDCTLRAGPVNRQLWCGSSAETSTFEPPML